MRRGRGRFDSGTPQSARFSVASGGSFPAPGALPGASGRRDTSERVRPSASALDRSLIRCKPGRPQWARLGAARRGQAGQGKGANGACSDQRQRGASPRHCNSRLTRRQTSSTRSPRNANPIAYLAATHPTPRRHQATHHLVQGQRRGRGVVRADDCGGGQAGCEGDGDRGIREQPCVTTQPDCGVSTC